MALLNLNHGMFILPHYRENTGRRAVFASANAFVSLPVVSLGGAFDTG